MRAAAVVSLAISLVWGCGSGSDGPTARFELPTDVGVSPRVDDIPFPNDVFLDPGTGELIIPPESLPFIANADADARANLSAGFANQGCFGVTAGVTFPIGGLGDDGAIDPESATRAARIVEVASGTEVPVSVAVRPEGSVVVEPRRGTVLAESSAYAAVLGPELATTDGRAIAATSGFRRVVTGDPSGPWEERAAATLAGVPGLEDAVAAAVFTTCDLGADLEAISAQLDAAAPAAALLDRLYTAAELDALLGTPDDNQGPGIDNPGGPAHADIGFAVIGHFEAPNYLAETPSTQGFFERGADGPIAKGAAPIPFVLAIPAGAESLADLPVVVFQHGINGSARDVFGVANGLNARGFAVIAIDLPFHGGRFPEARDNVHNFTGAEGPDGLADSAGANSALYFFDVLPQPHVTWLDPRLMSDHFRQAIADVMALARLLDTGDWSEIAAADPDLAELAFRGDRIAFASESFGGFVGVPALAFEERYTGGFLSVAGGGLTTQLLEESAVYGPLFTPIIQGAFSVGPNEVLAELAPPHTHYIYQLLAQVLDPADPLAYAARTAARGIPLLLPMAHLDESVPNNSSEALAAALGLAWQPEAGEREGPTTLAPDAMDVAEPGATVNIAFARDPAAHGMLTRATDLRRFEKVDGYYVALDPPLEIVNPITELQDRLGDFAAAVVSP
jgi:pimeloyl-ACP methyl ester carboxylesterase